jgi:phage terminase small subunit
MAKLTEKQRKFVLYYEGDATKAAIKAGYSPKTAHVTGYENLRKPMVAAALLKRQIPKDEKAVASVVRRQEILTEIAEQTDHKDRVKAVDVLNKMDALYIQRHEVEDVTKRPLKERMYGAIQQILKDPEGRKMIKEAAEGLE